MEQLAKRATGGRRETAAGSFEIVVVFTGARDTVQAMRVAADLSQGLSATLRLLVLNVVPYPLGLDEPVVGLARLQQSFCRMAAAAGVPASVDIRLCRDAEEAALQALPARTLVVMGVARRPFWRLFPTGAQRLARGLARRLTAAGHHVVVSDSQ